MKHSLGLYIRNNKEHYGRILPAFLQAVLVILFFSGCGMSAETADAVSFSENLIEITDAVDVPEVILPIYITEVMTSNKTVIDDGSGNYPDWFELTNTGSEYCTVSGYHVSNDPNNPQKWTIPNVSLSPGASAVIFCVSGSTDSDNHISTSLNRKGLSLVLSSPRGEILQTVRVPELREDQSLCIDGDTTTLTFYATPGFSNSKEGYELFLNETDLTGKLVINEVCVYNRFGKDVNEHKNDWIELKNISNEPVILSDYCLKNNLKSDNLYYLPNKTLAPDDIFVVYCAEITDQTIPESVCLNFSLNSKDDTLFLFRSDGMLSDKIGLHDIPLGGTTGRLDGCKGFFFFFPGTPDNENVNGFRYRAASPIASVPSGRYNDVESLTVSLEADGEIYYTMDGSEPSIESEKYNDPFILEKTTIIRAISVSDSYLQSEAATFVYQINENDTLPSVFISAENFSSLYGEAISACDANVTYLGEEGEFCRNCKLELHGTSFRKAPGKKSYKITFSDRYGGDLDYNVFENDKISSFHSLNIRGSLIDNAEMLLYYDSLVSLAANEICEEYIDPLCLNSKYCTLYINGKYYGIFALREAYSTKYAADHLGGDEKDYTIIRPPLIGAEKKDFIDLYTYILGNDMRDEACYSYVNEHMNLKSMAVWLCFESFYGNLDSGNIRFVRNTRDNGKWQTMLYDFDISIHGDCANWNSVIYSDTSASDICRSLLVNDNFKTLLVETASDLQQRGLGETLTLRILDELVDQLAADMPKDLKKWGINADQYSRGIEQLYSCFPATRSQSWLSQLKRIVGFSEEEMRAFFPDFQS